MCNSSFSHLYMRKLRLREITWLSKYATYKWWRSWDLKPLSISLWVHFLPLLLQGFWNSLGSVYDIGSILHCSCWLLLNSNSCCPCCLWFCHPGGESRHYCFSGSLVMLKARTWLSPYSPTSPKKVSKPLGSNISAVLESPGGNLFSLPATESGFPRPLPLLAWRMQQVLRTLPPLLPLALLKPLLCAHLRPRSVNAHTLEWRVSTPIIPELQVKKPRHREAKPFVQIHVGSRRQKGDLNPGISEHWAHVIMACSPALS